MDLSNEQVFLLLREIAASRESALRTLYESYGRTIYRFALARLRDPADAEEVVVDTMHEVWRHPDRFRGEAKFSTWLLGIARHKALSKMRSREPEHEDLESFDGTLESADAGAFEILAQKQRREGVRHCMERLPEEQRECLHLVFYEGYSLHEVAMVQGCPTNTVKTRLFHARQKLRNCLSSMLARENGDG
jgi:RNA polymerase sigma-70 factor, ECF subfamily